MRYVIHMGTDVVGTDTEEFVEFPASRVKIEQEAWLLALQHAETYFEVVDEGEVFEDSEYQITTDQVWYTVTPWSEDLHGAWPGEQILT